MNIRAVFARAGMNNWGVLQNEPDEQLRGRTLPDKHDADVPTPFGSMSAFSSLYPNQSPRDHRIMTGIAPYLLFRANTKTNPAQYLPATGTPTPQASAQQINQSYLQAPATVPGGGIGQSVRGAGWSNMLGD